MTKLFAIMLSRAVIANAVRVSLVVGICLNLINQGAAIWNGAPVQWGKLLLNFAVPYAVASYSAAKARQAIDNGAKPVDKRP